MTKQQDKRWTKAEQAHCSIVLRIVWWCATKIKGKEWKKDIQLGHIQSFFNEGTEQTDERKKQTLTN